jgi:proteasome lid subunit RPN8/RPN11
MEKQLKIILPRKILRQIEAYTEKSYPEESAGLMLGREEGESRIVDHLIFLDNAREDSARHNRYLITAEDMLQGELEANKRGLSIVGIFHSHPDHPNQPSEFDREYAIPWYSYLITSVYQGQAGESRCWRLADDRGGFNPEEIVLGD